MDVLDAHPGSQFHHGELERFPTTRLLGIPLVLKLLLGGFVNGLLITFLPGLLMSVMGSFGMSNSTFGDADFCWYGTVVGRIINLGFMLGAIVLFVAAWIW